MRASSVDQAIVDVLARENAHMTSARVFDAIRERLPALSLSTVYRALERLAKQGRVSVSDMGTGSAVYELLEQSIHHHIVCQRCGRVTDLGSEIIADLFSAIQARYHYEVQTNHLILFGTCESCSGRATDLALPSEGTSPWQSGGEALGTGMADQADAQPAESEGPISA
jgi:Fur family transcriptional regulator, ferric uptake regulator